MGLIFIFNVHQIGCKGVNLFTGHPVCYATFALNFFFFSSFFRLLNSIQIKIACFAFLINGETLEDDTLYIQPQPVKSTSWSRKRMVLVDLLTTPLQDRVKNWHNQCEVVDSCSTKWWLRETVLTELDITHLISCRSCKACFVVTAKLEYLLK